VSGPLELLELVLELVVPLAGGVALLVFGGEPLVALGQGFDVGERGPPDRLGLAVGWVAGVGGELAAHRDRRLVGPVASHGVVEDVPGGGGVVHDNEDVC
jgi:hypothetical protein